MKLAGLLWQCMVFLRTDLYAVLVNALGCRDLWRVKSLLLGPYILAVSLAVREYVRR